MNFRGGEYDNSLLYTYPFVKGKNRIFGLKNDTLLPERKKAPAHGGGGGGSKIENKGLKEHIKVVFIAFSAISAPLIVVLPPKLSLYASLSDRTRAYSTFTIPLQAGYLEQPKNALPARGPFEATRLTIGAPHFGQRIRKVFDMDLRNHAAKVMLFTGMDNRNLC